MNNYGILAISMAANLSGGIIKKHINDRFENNKFSYQFYNCIVSFASAFTLLIMSESLKVSFFTVVFALAFGVVTLIQQITNLYALEKGPFSYTSVIISLSTLIPTLSGALFWNEKISVVQFVGIFLLVLCFVLSVNFKNSDKKASLQWFFYCIAAFICTGLIGVMQKVHQSSEYKNELDGFLVIAFTFSFLCSGVLSLFMMKNRTDTVNSDKKSVVSVIPAILMLLSGVFVALNNKFNLFLSGVMDSAVFFPVVNGGGLVLTSLSAVVIFREKLSLKRWIGIIIGILSVLLLCDPLS